ncbi:unnamed protein product [Pleuronectes platessa]|uniref:Calx-beta domain-containing protein n=1 Tax=Pleuronectes platessa TaxID=8262 RepID=A0A9N7U233_PLEPL|nr:unnamed protein product [Pleuronectes platessa]
MDTHWKPKLVHVKIIDDEEYEKNKNFFLELAEPRMVDMSLQKGPGGRGAAHELVQNLTLGRCLRTPQLIMVTLLGLAALPEWCRLPRFSERERVVMKSAYDARPDE